jgi:hypothetical protein
MFSERDFWFTKEDQQQGLPPKPENKKYVYQSTFEVPSRGDQGYNPSNSVAFDVQNEGSTYPVWDATDPLLPSADFVGYPKEYRKQPKQDKDYSLTGTVRVMGNMVEYNFTLGQFVGNNVSSGITTFTEAAMYFRYLKNENPNDPQNGNPLGQLFSMKTFPPQYKDSSCSLKITWKLYF